MNTPTRPTFPTTNGFHFFQSNIENILNARLITRIEDLCARLELSPDLSNTLAESNHKFPICIPESLLDRIAHKKIDDPVLKQFIPSVEELVEKEGFSTDPLCEQLNNKHTTQQRPNCILQKYDGRILVITCSTCAARCRFCFRRHFHETPLFPIPQKFREFSSQNGLECSSDKYVLKYLEQVFAGVVKDHSIHEIIFSGGDPLTVPNKLLNTLLHYISTLEYVNRVRFHTRVPILTPQRIDPNFPASSDFEKTNTKRSPLMLYIVLHINSPYELNTKSIEAIKKLRDKGYLLTTQTVLLKGVNDSAEVLIDLFEKLINIGVFPYYLHQLDHVQGASHFEVPITKGLEIMEKIATKLPGYAVPKYVQEIPGKQSKTNLLTGIHL